jgi:Uma2 family endonuclease
MTMPVPGCQKPPLHLPRRYVRPIVAVHFPSGDEMPETHRHRLVRTALYVSVEREIGERATVGSDQFVYWDPTDAGQWCAPDLMVRLGIVKRGFPSWKVWEDGAPELAVEIISESDAGSAAWRDKIARYRKLGVLELVGFDASDLERPLRIWDHVDGDLVERDRTDPTFSHCDVLDAYWQVREDSHGDLELRLSRDAQGKDLWLTPAEGEGEARLRAEERNREVEGEIERLRRG